MSRVINISKAATIGIHGLVLIARSKSELNVTVLSKMMGASRHHLAKVFQQLGKAGFLKSKRGPTGGFMLKKLPDEITILEIFEAVEGKIEAEGCPMEQRVCPFNKCLFEGIVKKSTETVIENMRAATLAEFV